MIFKKKNLSQNINFIIKDIIFHFEYPKTYNFDSTLAYNIHENLDDLEKSNSDKYGFDEVVNDNELTKKHENDEYDENLEIKRQKFEKKPLKITNSFSNKNVEIKLDNERKDIPKSSKDDELLEIISCSICSDVMHDCISVQPCLHCYCAGCYSEWMAKSDECPLCKKKVERIAKNHIVNNIIETYLKNNPEKKRSEKDLKELDKKNNRGHDKFLFFSLNVLLNSGQVLLNA